MRGVKRSDSDSPAGGPEGGFANRLERTAGPSCLLSLVIAFLLILVLKRAVTVGPLAMAVVALVVWLAVLALLLRSGALVPSRGDNGHEPGETQ